MKSFSVALCFFFAYAVNAQRNAIAVIDPIGTNSVHGSVVFDEIPPPPCGKATVEVTVNLSGLTPGAQYGSHIHNWGDISDSEKGLSTGGHFNPTHQNHSCPIIPGVVDPESIGAEIGHHHVGDYLPSGYIKADEDGKASFTIPAPGVSLEVLDDSFIIGRTLVVHASSDDCTSQPTGNAGGRIGQGIIGWGSAPPSASTESEMSDVSKKQAIAVLQPINTDITGTVQLIQEDETSPVKLYIKASGAPPNTVLAWHVHNSGNISDTTAGLSTMSHFNPFDQVHGCFKNETRHAGDLDNLETDSMGNIEKTISSDLLSLFKGSKSYAYGRAIVIHAKTDECIGATGNAGGRIAQGVIGYRDESLSFDGGMMMRRSWRRKWRVSQN